MYELPSKANISKCVITKEVVEKDLEPTVVTLGGEDSEDAEETPKEASA